MATISSLGAGSGLDLNSLLTNLMQAEQQPLLALQTKEASYQSKISALGTLSSALSSLQTAASSMIPTIGTTAEAKYTTASASVADTSIATATATSSAVTGSYSLEVSSLAQNQRLVTPSTAGYTSSTSAIGTGTLKIEFGTLSSGTFTADGSRTKSITINSSNKTLGGLRDAINAANGGVSATIINGTEGSRLVLTSKETGLSNVMKLSISTTAEDTTPLTGFDYDPATNTGTLTQDSAQGGQAATNASFKLNGISGTSSTNTVGNALDGVTLTLLKQTTSATTISVSKSTVGSITSALNAFVKAYNDANKSMTELGAYNAETKVAGTLQGNATLRSAKSQMSNLIFSTTAGGSSAYQTLAQIGVSIAKDGSLSLDSTKLNAAVTADATGVANLVAAVGTSFKSTIESLVGTAGTISSAKDGMNSIITTLTKRQQALSDRLTRIESSYRKQFTALDSLVSSMKQTSTYLTQQLANLPSTSSSSS